MERARSWTAALSLSTQLCPFHPLASSLLSFPSLSCPFLALPFSSCPALCPLLSVCPLFVSLLSSSVYPHQPRSPVDSSFSPALLALGPTWFQNRLAALLFSVNLILSGMLHWHVHSARHVNSINNPFCRIFSREIWFCVFPSDPYLGQVPPPPSSDL